jgi:hypothetical protein
MYHHRPVVQQNPAGCRVALDVQSLDVCLALERLSHVASQGADLPLAVPIADNEIVGHDRDWPNIEQNDVARLLVLDQLNDPLGQVQRFQ